MRTIVVVRLVINALNKRGANILTLERAYKPLIVVVSQPVMIIGGSSGACADLRSLRPSRGPRPPQQEILDPPLMIMHHHLLQPMCSTISKSSYLLSSPLLLFVSF